MKVLNVAQVRRKKKFSATIFSNLNSISELKKDNLTNLSVYLHKCEIKKNSNNFLLHSPFPSVSIYVESKLPPTY